MTYVVKTSPLWRVAAFMGCLTGAALLLLADHVGNSYRCSELKREHSVYVQTYCR